MKATPMKVTRFQIEGIPSRKELKILHQSFKKLGKTKVMKNIYVRVGENIRRLRENADLSIKELAGYAKISASFLVNIENAQRKPTLFTIESIAKALDVSVRDVIGMEVIENPAPEDRMLEFKLKAIVSHMPVKLKQISLKLLTAIYPAADKEIKRIDAIPQIRW